LEGKVTYSVESTRALKESKASNGHPERGGHGEPALEKVKIPLSTFYFYW
jgi:hypothetical protein